MTVTTTLDRQYFDGDGSNKVFPFNFRFFTDDQIYVSLVSPSGTVTPQILTTNYTLSGALQAGGGTVTMIVAPPLTVPATRVFIQRIVPQVQPTSIRNQGKFYPEIHEDAFDRLTMLIQQALAGLGNSLQLTFSKTGWNFLGYRGINAGDPINDQDVTTKSWVANQISGANGYAYSLYLKSLAYAESLVAGVVGGYGSFMQGGIGAIIRTFQGKMREQVSVSDFGDVEGGVVDAGAAVQRALDYLATLGGGELIYPPGIYKHITTPKIPVNLPRTLLISAYGAKIVAVSGGRIFDVNRTADDQTLQNIILRGMFIDFTAMTGRHHVLIGCYVNGTNQLRVNFRNILLEDIRGIGPDPDPTKINHIICVYIQCAHRFSREAVAGYMDDITLRNVKMNGGNAGYLITGNAIDNGEAPNVTMSTVTVLDCEHKLTQTPEVFFSSSNLHIGLDAEVRRVTIDGFYGENAGDNTIELNNVRNATVVNTRGKNYQNVGYYLDNKNPDFDASLQVVVYENCTGDMDGYGARAFQVGPYRTSGAGEFRGHLGQITYDNCSVRVRGKSPTSGGYGIHGGLTGTYFFDAMTITDFKVDVIGSDTLVADGFPAVFSFRSQGPVRITIDGVTHSHQASITQGAFIYRPRILNLYGDDARLTLLNVRANFNITGVTDVFRAISLEGGKANILASNVKVTSNIATSFLHVSPSDAFDSTHRAILEDSDWTTAAAGSVIVNAPTNDQRRYVRVKDVRVPNPLGAVRSSGGVSPRTLLNLVGYNKQVIVTGGTGVIIEVDGGTGTFVDTGLSSGSFDQPVGNTVRISFTTAPTVVEVHLGT